MYRAKFTHIMNGYSAPTMQLESKSREAAEQEAVLRSGLGKYVGKKDSQWKLQVWN